MKKIKIHVTQTAQLRKKGYSIWDEDVARLSPLIYDPINRMGRAIHSLYLTQLLGENWDRCIIRQLDLKSPDRWKNSEANKLG